MKSEVVEFRQGDQIIWRKIAQFFKSSQNSCQANKCQNTNCVFNSLFRFKYDKFVAQGIAILGGYFFNEPTKSSLTDNTNLVTLSLG